MICRLQLMK